jgi:hypothetical protein
VLAWRLSVTLDSDFCIEALEEALSKGTPKIFNTDQGSQFPSEAFTGILLQHGIQISMDGRGRCRERPHQALGYRTPKEIFETKGPSTGGIDASTKTIMAQEEPERRCFCDTDLIPHS